MQSDTTKTENSATCCLQETHQQKYSWSENEKMENDVSREFNLNEIVIPTYDEPTLRQN